MKIDNITTLRPKTLKRTSKPRGDVFDVGTTVDQTNESSFVSSTGDVTSLASLMHLQEMTGQEASSQETLKLGDSALSVLEDLQQEILQGSITQQTLKNIQSALNRLPSQATPPKLQEAIREIHQRVAIELAKLEMSTNRTM